MQRIGFGVNSFALSALGFSTNASTAIYNPLTLFAAGQQGAIYDPSDLTTLFQDAEGTVPVTTSGDPVGLMLDKSGNGNHATQTLSSARPTYQTDGILHWLAFDGVDDRFSLPNWGVLPNLDSVCMGLYSQSGRALWTRGNGIILSLKQDVGLLTVYNGEYRDISFTPSSKPIVLSRRSSATLRTHSLNGVIVDSAVPVNGYLTPGHHLGAYFDGSAEFLKGRFYGLVLVNDNISDTEVRQIDDYIASKSGVAL